MLPDPTPFLTDLFEHLHSAGIDVSGFELDHICYRVETRKRYAEMKSVLLERGRLLIESNIGGRPIATYKLNGPFVFHGRKIHVIELPAPKKGSAYSEGFEHVEFVITMPLKVFIARFPSLSFDLSGMDKPTNADVRSQLGKSSVKFHCASLESVIEAEKG